MSADKETKSEVAAVTKSDKRRKLVTGIVTGGGVVAGSQWVKPVVNSLSLPAHAATTDVAPSRSVVNINLTITATDSGIMDLFIGSAHAAPAPQCGLPRSMCVDRPSLGTVNIGINGGSSGNVAYTSGSPFFATVVAGGINFRLGNVVINDAANTINGNVSCDTDMPKNTDPNANFSGTFVDGSCAAI